MQTEVMNRADPGLRRRGIATALYDAAEELGFRLAPSPCLDHDGALFWESRSTKPDAGPPGA